MATNAYGTTLATETRYDYDERGNLLVITDANQHVTRSDMVDNTEDLLLITTFTAARQFIIRNSAAMTRTLIGAAPRIAALANSRAPADAARFETHLGIAGLLMSLGAF